MSEYETIEFEVADNVATITLNRPEKMNSFNEQMVTDLGNAWRAVRDTDDIHVAVLRAAGDRSFCTGIDVAGGRWWGDMNVWNHRDPGELIGPKSRRVWKPVVAAVQGMCAGGGQYLINESDIVICSDQATFFDPHMNGDVVSACEPIGLLQRGVPLGDVLRWALMGNEERITADTALRLGIVSEVTTTEDLWERAAFIAAGIARRHPEAVQGTVRAIWESMDVPASVAKHNALSYTHIGNVKAFAARGVADGRPVPERRKPEFR
jgi:enoyl-CoA hydratase/carnithine racemase